MTTKYSFAFSASSRLRERIFFSFYNPLRLKPVHLSFSICFSSCSSFSLVRCNTADCTSNSSRVTRFILVSVDCSRLLILASMSSCICFTSPGMSELMRLVNCSSGSFMILNSDFFVEAIVNQIVHINMHQCETMLICVHRYGAAGRQ